MWAGAVASRRVALGLSETLRIHVGVVRLIFVLLFFFDGAGLLLYILLDLLMPPSGGSALPAAVPRRSLVAPGPE